MSFLNLAVCGALCGCANGLFGAGGGIAAVMVLKRFLDTKAAHATSLILTMPMSIISSIFYSIKGNVDFKTALALVPFGLVGAVLGSRLLLKISAKILKKLFALLLIICALRLIL